MESGIDIGEIWTQYRSGLKAFVHARVSNPADVEDLMQEILIKTHIKLGTLKTQDSLRAWLYQVANHSIVDFYRRDKSKRPINPDDLWYATIDDDPLPDLTQCIEPFIDALPVEFADLLRAIDLEGKSQKEQAETLGVSYSTLKSRVQSGRKQLRQVFEACCDFSVDQRGTVVDYQKKSDQCGDC